MLKEEDIKLFPHNEKGYQALVKGLENNPLAFLEHATGTGKSFILLKYLYAKMRQKRILFISMHDEMFEQLFNEQMPTLGMKKSDFTKFDTMIYPNILKHNMQDIIKNYDCIVFDEAHHCGAEKWGEKVLELKNLVLNTPGKKMIGATATGTRYLDNYMDVSEIYFNGNTVSRLPISTSILNNLLPAPFYINSLSSSIEYLNRVEKKLSKIPVTSEISVYIKRIEELRNKIEKESSISEVLKKYNVKPGEKYIVFCKNIKDLEEKRKEAQSWFKNIGTVKTFTAHSGQKKDQNIANINEFSKSRDEISLMFAVDIFNEGFHIDGVDGILMFRKTKSPIVYFQQIGRALSFSVRKKQIKIFDFVNNLAESDIIYDLYKEIISETRKLIQENPENKELYEEILKRFEIIDETTSIIDELKNINAYLDENYIVKNDINNAIRKLEEYRNFYPNTDFRVELINKRLSPDYVNAYKYICHMEDYLTNDQVILLQQLNIDYNKNINLSIEERENLLQGSKTFHELKEKQVKTFKENYIAFYQNFNRRPENTDNKEEFNLYKQYRYYLENLSLSKLRKLINSFPFPPTTEELILLGNYPEKNQIEEYLHLIETKIANNIHLDNIEIKVLKRINRLIMITKPSLINYINNLDDINLKIEKAIAIIKKYKREVNPNERFTNFTTIIGEREVYNAIKTIHKYSKRIINSQFEQLLELDIKLPHNIDMTLEHRLELLKGYNSFYDLERGYNFNVYKEYISFIYQNRRRPNPSVAEENELYEKYITFLKKSTSPKIKEVCNILKEYNIELSFYEKAIIGDYLSKEEIGEFTNHIKNKLKSNIDVTAEELKLLRAIEKHNYDINIEEISYLIKQSSSINKISQIISKLEEVLKDSSIPESKKDIEHQKATRELREYYKYITKHKLNKLISLNIDVPSSLIEEINNLSSEINLYERELIQKNEIINSFISYIKKNKKRPEKNSPLDLKYRRYIGGLTIGQLKKFTALILENKIELSFEEKVLLGQFTDENQRNDYIKSTEFKINNNIPLDSLEKRVYYKLKKSGLLSKKIRLRSEVSPESIEDKIVSNLRLCIEKNPDLPINYNSSIYRISAINQRKLEQFRLNILSKRLFTEILRVLKQTKKPLNECLSLESLTKLEEYSSFTFLDEENSLLLKEIRNINIDNNFLSKGLARKNFIDSYISFISTNGRRPNLITDDDYELQLALAYDELKNSLGKSELSKIESVIAKKTSEVEKASFYDDYYNFIVTNGRFPCGNSDNPEEVHLNNLYLSLNKTFTREQMAEIKKLKKLYSKATLQANLRFSKKK